MKTVICIGRRKAYCYYQDNYNKMREGSLATLLGDKLNTGRGPGFEVWLSENCCVLFRLGPVHQPRFVDF
ncbi:hypothetical protein VTK26DRAFT_3392 [Humicola hyalothermophila]